MTRWFTIAAVLLGGVLTAAHAQTPDISELIGGRPQNPRLLPFQARVPGNQLEVVFRETGGRPEAAQTTDEQLLKSLGIATDGPGLLKFLRKRTLTDFTVVSRPDSRGGRRAIEPRAADHERVLAHIRKFNERSYHTREQATRELIDIGIPALPALRAAQGHADLEVQYRAEFCIAAIERNPGPNLAAAVIRLLRQRRPEGTVAALIAYVPFADDETVEEEILVTLHTLAVRDGKTDPSLLLALQNTEPERRAAAALILGQHGNAEQRPLVRRLLSDADAKVRLRAAQGLIVGREAGATATLIALLGEGGFEQAREAEDMLMRMAGERAPRVDLEMPDAARRRCRDAWAGWWKFNKDKLDLTRASEFVVLNPTRKAREGAEQYMQAYIAGDTDLLRKMTELPFYDLEANRLIRTKDALEKTLQEAIAGRNDNNLPLFSVAAVQSMNDLLKSVPPNRRGVLAKLRRPDIRAVWVDLVFEDTVQQGETVQDRTIFFIRIGNGPPRVVGTANDGGGP